MDKKPLYEIRDSYRRFDTRNWIFIRSMWDPKIMNLPKERRDNIINSIAQGIHGYTLKDYALSTGETVGVSLGTFVNLLNSRSTK